MFNRATPSPWQINRWSEARLFVVSAIEQHNITIICYEVSTKAKGYIKYLKFHARPLCHFIYFFLSLSFSSLFSITSGETSKDLATCSVISSHAKSQFFSIEIPLSLIFFVHSFVCLMSLCFGTRTRPAKAYP